LTKLGVKRLRGSELYVLDATPVIHFAKIDKLRLVLETFKVRITREDFRETVERGHGRPDAIAVSDAVAEGWLEVYEVRNRSLVKRLLRHPEIHLGEAETLAAAKELEGFAVIDEADARTVAKTFGIKTRTGTLFLLFRLLALGKLGATESERILEELVESGLYIDSRTFIRAKRKIRNKG
jgi:predicted nucleic acid-binding protein